MDLIQLFESNQALCTNCSRRISGSRFLAKFDDIGICKTCGKKLSPVLKGSVFEGTPNIKYLISPYYYSGTIKHMFHRYKFKGEKKLGGLFSNMLYDYIKDIDILHDFDFITAVPLSKERLAERGYNQSEIIAAEISDMLDIPHVQCLYRSKNTDAQSTLDKHNRTYNISDAFIADKRRTEGKNIILLDDIFTTGATMNSCAAELIDKGAKSVIGISVAKTPLF